MKVGITYDLREEYLAMGYSAEETAEFDKPETVSGIELCLRALGHTTERIGHARNLMQQLLQGRRWDLVFNIAEGLYGLGREALVPALLDAWKIPYTFADPMVLALTLHKGQTKRIIRDLGLPTADFIVVEDESDLNGLRLPFPLFAKPVAEGTGKGIGPASRVETPQALAAVCRQLLARFGQPVLVETFLPGREFTVGVIGTGPRTEAVAVMEVILKQGAEPDSYSYDNKENYVGRVEYRRAENPIARQAADVAVSAWRGLGCRDAGRVDLRADARGTLNFIEVNPLAGLNPIHSDLPILCRMAGMSYLELLAGIMRSASLRLDPA